MYVSVGCVGVCPGHRVLKAVEAWVPRQFHLVIRCVMSGASCHPGCCSGRGPRGPPSPGAR